MVDMKVRYLGMELPHPFIVGACPIGDPIDAVRRAEDAGAAALVLRSLFEEQIDTEAMATYYAMESHSNSFPEATGFMADPLEFKVGPQEYLDHLQRVKRATRIPIIASLNGTSLGGWLTYAQSIEKMGADALELNVFDVPMNEKVSGDDLEKETVEMVTELRSQIRIPIAVKIGPFYTSLPHFASRLQAAGADALVIFNRFFEPDIDIENLEVLQHMRFSDSRELLLRLRWLSILSGLLGKTQLAVTGGVHTPSDAAKAIMCGASAIQLVASLMRNGTDHIRRMRLELQRWISDHEYESLESMRGSMNILRSPNPSVYSRANYMRMLQTWESE